MVVFYQRGSTHTLLLSRPSLPQIILALCKHPDRTVDSRLGPAPQWDQFYVVDPCRFRLPMVHEAPPLPLVAAIQLSSRSRIRCRCDHWPIADIPLAANAAERRYRN
jgi:hypothetical protein